MDWGSVFLPTTKILGSPERVIGFALVDEIVVDQVKQKLKRKKKHYNHQKPS